MGEFDRALAKVLVHEGGYVNDPADDKKKDAQSGQENPAGLFCYARIRYVRPESVARVHRRS